MADNASKFCWPPIGQDKVSSFLEKSLLSGKLAQTYIFTGPKDLGKSSLALAFARNLWQQDRPGIDDSANFDSINSDLYILEREKDKHQIGVEAAREFIKKLGMSSFFNSYKIGIIKEAETLSAEAQNALLKTLEEPREQVIIIILTEKIEKLLATIVSRSQVLYFYPVSKEAVYDYLLASLKLKRSLAKELAAAALGRPLQARKWAENPDAYQEYKDRVQSLFNFLKSDLSGRLNLIESVKDLSAPMVLSWIDIWESLWRDALLIALGQEDRLCYPELLPEWKNNFLISAAASLDNLQRLYLARSYVQGFVNPKNILDSLAIYF